MKLGQVVVDRPFGDALVAVGATSLVFAVAFVLPPYLEGNGRISEVLLGAAVGLVVATVGFAAASRTRPLPQPDPRQRLVRVLGVAGAGVGLGLLNLGANRALASLDPRIYARLVERVGQLSPWTSTLAAPVVEEVVMRLAVLSALAWVTSLVVKRPRKQFIIALWMSSLVFGLLHGSRPALGAWPLDQLYLGGVVLKSGLLGACLGWIFWRWGLPYSILCHALVNGTHVMFERWLFS